MAALFKLYLTVTGIGAAISILIPTVVVGMFLILPGLILAMMPTAFNSVTMATGMATSLLSTRWPCSRSSWAMVRSSHRL